MPSSLPLRWSWLIVLSCGTFLGAVWSSMKPTGWKIGTASSWKDSRWWTWSVVSLASPLNPSRMVIVLRFLWLWMYWCWWRVLAKPTKCCHRSSWAFPHWKRAGLFPVLSLLVSLLQSCTAEFSPVISSEGHFKYLLFLFGYKWAKLYLSDDNPPAFLGL